MVTDLCKGCGPANDLLKQGVDPLTATDTIKIGDVYEAVVHETNGDITLSFEAEGAIVGFLVKVPPSSLPTRIRRRTPVAGDTVHEVQGSRKREGMVFGVDHGDAAVRWRDGGATVLNVSRLEVV